MFAELAISRPVRACKRARTFATYVCTRMQLKHLSVRQMLASVVNMYSCTLAECMTAKQNPLPLVLKRFQRTKNKCATIADNVGLL